MYETLWRQCDSVSHLSWDEQNGVVLRGLRGPPPINCHLQVLTFLKVWLNFSFPSYPRQEESHCASGFWCQLDRQTWISSAPDGLFKRLHVNHEPPNFLNLWAFLEFEVDLSGHHDKLAAVKVWPNNKILEVPSQEFSKMADFEWVLCADEKVKPRAFWSTSSEMEATRTVVSKGCFRKERSGFRKHNSQHYGAHRNVL